MKVIVNGQTKLKKNAAVTVSKTHKVTEKIISGVKTAVKAAKTVKEAAFQTVIQAYRVWKRLDLASYRAQGQGTIANLRGKVALRLVKTRAFGQFCILHSSELGYGFTHGAKVDSETVHTGQMQVRFDKSQIVKTFNKFSELVQYVQKHGELNVQGTEKFRTLSNGGRYSLYSNGKSILRFEQSGKASGSYQDYQSDGKFYGKFAALKV